MSVRRVFKFWRGYKIKDFTKLVFEKVYKKYSFLFKKVKVGGFFFRVVFAVLK